MRLGQDMLQGLLSATVKGLLSIIRLSDLAYLQLLCFDIFVIFVDYFRMKDVFYDGLLYGAMVFDITITVS